ncbi:unnamed protein product [Rotaria magnacalcarata]|nr:unnamed protein product [Rotaria magnacalcarata]CAF2130636.1 unnamed protein product [Rotaria magnacalcarata]
MSDEEVEMVLDRKSRFSRYRTRVRERINLDVNQAMQIDDNNIASVNEISDSEEPNAVFIDKMPVVMHDASSQTLDLFANPEIEQHEVENSDDNDVDQLRSNSNIFRLLNNHNNKFKESDLHESESDSIDSSDKNDDVEEMFETQYNTFDSDFEAQQPPNATELSVMLVFVWRRHSMSKAAANDICRILNTFNIPNMPKNFRGVMSHIKKNNPTLLHGIQSFICPSCFNKSSSASKCIANGCRSASSYVRTPTSIFIFPILPQIISILERENLVSLTYESDQCSDVMNSQRHHEIVMKEKQIHPGRNIVTLTLNSDGVLIKRLSRSLWITCACINELPRRNRFDINNMLICSISTGDEKPKKSEYSTILIDIVNELKLLENIGFDVVLPSDRKNNKHHYTRFHAFTISAVCDKPAQSLVMNIKDPTGYFSCGWCCIQG